VNSLPARAYGVIRRPRATFAAIVACPERSRGAAPTWAGVLISTTIITFLCSAGFLRTAVGQQALADQWERTALAFGQPVDDARYARMEDNAANGRFGLIYASASALASGPALAFGLSALLYLVLSRMTGDSRGADPASLDTARDAPSASRRDALSASRRAGPRASYVQVLAVVCYGGVILALRQVIATPIDYARESIASPTTLVQFVTMLDEASPVARFLGVIDLFVVWWIVVLAIGMSVLYRLSTRRLALVFTGTYVALALLAVIAMAVSGGTA
jgi:hypothetical protein